MSDELADSLESGDSCAATQTAARLRESVTEAINDGKVPEVYLEDLSGLANELEHQVPACVEPPPPSGDEDDGDDEKKEKDKDKGKGKGKGKDRRAADDDGDDDPTESIPAETVPIPTTVVTTETDTEPPTTAEEGR